MINVDLTREIARQIGKSLGVGDFKHPLFKLDSNEFKLKKKIKVQLDDESFIENNLFCAKISSKDDKSLNLRFLLADLSENNNKDYIIVIRFNDSSPYVIRLGEAENYFVICFLLENDKWTFANTKMQASLLYGIESLLDFNVGLVGLNDCEDL